MSMRGRSALFDFEGIESAMDQRLILIGASVCQAGFRERAKSVPSNWIYSIDALLGIDEI